MRFAVLPVALLLVAGAALAQTPVPRAPKYALSPRPVPLTPWVAPNRPHWKLSELLAAHAGQAGWSQTLVQDSHFTGRYIQMAPGEKTKTLFYADTEMFWVVQAGRMRVTVEGLDPFTAAKGFLVQIPARTPFRIETLDDAPSLRFEVIHSGALPVYPESETPTPLAGYKYMRVAYAAPQVKHDPAEIYLDFNKDIVEGGARAGRFLKAGSLIRGASVPTPADDDLGHFHIDASEFWFIMEGKLDYSLEGAPPFTAEQGDVVYAPHGRFHRNNFTGGGMATRLAIFPVGNLNNLDADNPSRQSP